MASQFPISNASPNPSGISPRTLDSPPPRSRRCCYSATLSPSQRSGCSRSPPPPWRSPPHRSSCRKDSGTEHRIDVDQEGGVGVAQELEQRSDEVDSGRLLELSGGRREGGGDGGDEGEGGGDGDLADAEVAKGEVEVGDGGEEGGGGLRENLEKLD
ncbi:hypothetical protein Ahy_A07g031994 isoform D [Arachis hypogaea]|uniref:Uncharacterized protein n=1 Tax=Arachis hypogaea TaxID=3818 RepID=A0A445C5P2_ARAHY|nr:hypothetical protein Ahy_A07g031994 isoform D [Arachis hypogaea]